MSESRWIALLLVGVYTALMLYLAWVGKKRTRGLVDYYVGGRGVGGVALGLSFFATYASTNSYLGFSGKAYAYGAPWLLLVPAAVGFSWLAWRFIAARLRDLTASLESVTLPDYIGFRFESQAARVVSALLVILASLLYMTAVYKGIGTLLETFLELSYAAAIGLVLVVVVLYTSVGGFHSVVRTDVVQALVMLVAASLLFAGISRAAGGLDFLSQLRAAPSTASLFTWDAAMPLPVLLGVIVATTIKFVVEPRQLSRFYALADRAAVRRGIWVSTLAFFVVFSLLAPIGLLAHGLLEGVEDTDRVVPELLSSGELFGPWVTGFLMVAMISAAMSSLDSVLLVVASTCQRDLTGLVSRAGEGTRLLTTRVYVVGFALLTAVIALRPPGGIVELTAFSGALYAACFLPAVVLGLYWRRGSGAAVLVSIAVGVAVLAGWRLLPWGAAVHEVFPAALLSLVAYSVVALVDAPAGGAVVDLYFRRISRS